MDENRHTDLLVLQSAELTARTPFCPEDQEISEYFDGRSSEARHEALEQHLADCRFCQARIGMLHRQQSATGSYNVPEEILATAKQLRPAIGKRRFHRASTWAAAAVIVIAAFSIFSNIPISIPERGINPDMVLPSHGGERQLRNIERSSTQLDLLLPAPGSIVAAGSLIRWSSMPVNTHYSIFVLSQAGDVLWSQPVQGTEWILPDELNLPAGDEVFLLVEAELPSGEKLSSKHLVLRTSQGK